ncbi:TnsA endonuclease N-terminal domain-containing protein [Azospirillum sp. TSO22-1]|uniref:TnsA endonuclease N-terminal domain-containing protein n=1 Tax=Azospirillum sp. TSO22-1 TaxID=716789 RepID=UPI001FFE9193|nr:TnsA endonuclease N-terminal domain-containing protein [Azospirillum sp. TSO22-1]
MVESTLERDFALLQRFDPAVAGIEEQPVRIEYRVGQGTKRHYVPDFLVTYQDAARPTRLVEVKYSTDQHLLTGSLEERFAAARDYAAERGWVFALVTEKEIRTPRLENATFLLPFRDRPPDPAFRDRMLEATGREPVTVQELADLVAGDAGDRARVLPSLWALVARFEIMADLDQPITMRTVLRRPRRGSA